MSRLNISTPSIVHISIYYFIHFGNKKFINVRIDSEMIWQRLFLLQKMYYLLNAYYMGEIFSSVYLFNLRSFLIRGSMENILNLVRFENRLSPCVTIKSLIYMSKKHDQQTTELWNVLVPSLYRVSWYHRVIIHRSKPPDEFNIHSHNVSFLKICNLLIRIFHEFYELSRITHSAPLTIIL